MRSITSIFCLLLAFSLSGCNGSSNSTQTPLPTTAAVSGRVVDSEGSPLAGASISIENSATPLITDIQGRFTCYEVSPGTHRITVTYNGQVLCELCATTVEGVEYDLGELSPSTVNTCETTSECPNDRDCDGLPDSLEISGWQVTVYLGDGSTESRFVVSDPDDRDSDNDGLTDDQEYAARIDPENLDTDGDLLSDYGEFYVYKSHPLRVDSDGDSCSDNTSGCVSDPNFWDGYELFLLKTSPTLSDTDGDGMSDSYEILGGGTNPRLADLPELSLQLHGNPLLELNAEINQGISKTSQTLEKNNEEQVNTDNTSTKMSIENTVSLHTETKVGTGTWPPSASAKLTTDSKFSHALTHDTSSSWKKSSVSEAQDTFESWETEKVSYDDGKLGAAMKIVNQSDLSFKVKDLRVIAYRLEGGGNFTLIGTMLPGAAEWPEGGQILGPGGEFTMTMNRDGIGAQMMRDLVRNPTAMMFEVGSYSLFQLDEWGVEETINYAVLGETVVQQTGMVVIDFGNGEVVRHMVATNVYRNPNGSAQGITLKEILDEILQLDYQTEEAIGPDGPTGRMVLSRINNFASYDVCNENSVAFNPQEDCLNTHKQGFWMVGGTGRDFDDGAVTSFEKIRLNNGEQINLVYMEDSDGDGIFDREEILLGTDKESVDTDNDGLTDYSESKIGWQVSVSGQPSYTVFSDPRFSDRDSDYLSDTTEKYLGTDPFLKDTDGDGDSDAIDYDPLSPPCLEGTLLAVTAWWNGDSNSSTALDLWLADKNDGEIIGDDTDNPQDDMVITQNWKLPTLGIDVPNEQVFRFNPLPDQSSQFIQVADHDDLDAQREFSLSAWVYWQGVATSAPWATILSKGISEKPNYALYISPTGLLKLAFHRTTKVFCEQCSIFGCSDALCADSTEPQLRTMTSAEPIPSQEWVHVTATYSGETMRIYVDNILWAEASTTYTSQSGLNHRTYTTKILDINADPLMIGRSSDQIWPYRGLMDDIQIFGRGLSTDQALQLDSIGVCEP